MIHSSEARGTKESFDDYFDRIESKLDRNFDIIQNHFNRNNKN